MTTNKPNGSAKRHEVTPRQKWVTIGDMRVSPFAQREFSEGNPAVRDTFDPDLIGHPVLSHRGTLYYILDGQHRIEGYRRWIGEGWETQQLLCDTYEGLTEAQEAEIFLRHNTVKAVSTFEKFRIGINAERPVENDIDRVVRSLGLHISRQKGEGNIGAVGTLRNVYGRGGAGGLSRTLRIVRDAYGDPGMESPIIDGIGLLSCRFNGEVDEVRLVRQLAGLRQGAGGLLQLAYIQKKQTGAALPQCVAAAAVDVYNRSRAGNKLPSWWKVESP